MNQLDQANLNIKLYVFIKIFAKRVFLPLSAIYFIDNLGFTIQTIGLLSAIYSFTQLVVEVPTGYFADKLGRVKSIRIGALCTAIGTICYITFHAKTGIIAGTIFEAIGYSFMGGAGEALIHDSLVVKKQTHLYTKVLSKAQSTSLITNAILLATVPMTYQLDPRLPFLIGTVAYLALFAFSLNMRDLRAAKTRFAPESILPPRVIRKRHLLLFGLSFGIISALYTSSVDTFNVALNQFGIQASYLGWVYAGSSLLGALIGPYIHHLQGIHLSRYLLIDLFMLISLFVAALTGSAYLLAFVVMISVSFWRYRKIIYQSYLLNTYSTTLKATLISAMSNLEQLNSIWIPLALTSLVQYFGLRYGLGMAGLFALFIAPIFYTSALKFFLRDRLPQKLALNDQVVV